MTPPSAGEATRAGEVGGGGVLRETTGSEGGRRDPFIGKVIAGRYHILDKLGAGSIGTVYACADMTTTDRVALKVFRREFASDDDFMRRLRRQARLAVTLSENQPSILAVYDCDRTAEGNAFIAMECLEGRTLKDVIQREGALDVPRALRLACQIVEGLGAIHNAGYVHGDVRTENVILVTTGADETAKLKGFEVAALRETPPVERLILAEAISSNAEYMAPEQVEGDRATVRADIYAFGVLLYEMLAGRVPFSGAMPDNIMAKQLQDVPAPLGTFRPDIPSVLETRVTQALEKEPERRQRYVGDVANEDLCELVANEQQALLASERHGVLGRVASTLRGRLAARGALSGERVRPAYLWRAGVVAAAVILVSVLALWMRSSRQQAQRAEVPTLQKRLGAPVAVDQGRSVRSEEKAARSSVSRVPEGDQPITQEQEKEAVAAQPLDEATASTSTPRHPSREGALEPRTRARPAESSLLPPRARGSVQKRPRPVDRVEAPASEPRGVAPDPPTRPLPAPTPRAPAPPTRGTPEPTAIIDWLLGQPPGKD